MKRTVSVARTSKAYAVCVENASNPESLQVRKLYQVLADADAAKHGYLRVVDESGESYLYPEGYFVPVTLARPLPKTAQKTFA